MDEPERLGRYWLDRLLAVGGMAEVFLGRVAGVEGFEKRVVIKRILPNLADNPEFIEMFLDEARLAARFNHPNLVQVYELIKEDDNYCLVMEYIEGENVARIIDETLRQGKQVSVEMAAYLAAEAAEALYHAHQLRGDDNELLRVIHRDVTPSNVLVTWHGTVKVVDFGIAKSTDRSSSTQAGIIKGKFCYFSPEALRREPIDARADIFSLGAVLYELLTLSRAFLRDTPAETMAAIRSGIFIAVERKRRDMPPLLTAILNRMLEPDQDERYRSCREVADDLREFLMDRTTPNTTEVSTFMRELFEGANDRKRRTYIGVAGEDDQSNTVAAPDPSVKSGEELEKTRNIREFKRAEREKRRATVPDPFIAPPGFDEDEITDDGVELEEVSSADDLPEEATVDEGSIPVLDETRELERRLPRRKDQPVPYEVDDTSEAGRPWEQEETAPDGLKKKETPRAGQPWEQEDTDHDEPRLVGKPPAPELPEELDDTLLGLEPGLHHKRPTEARRPPLALILGGAFLACVAVGLIAGAYLITDKVPESPPPLADEGAGGGATAGLAPETTPQPVGKTPKPPPRRRPKKKSTGKIKLRSEPVTKVTLDGRGVGTTPVELTATSGKHVVVMTSKKDGIHKTFTIDVPKNGTESRNEKFKKGSVIIKTDPWSDVYLRGEHLGQTPKIVEVYEGTHVFRLVSGEKEIKRTVKVSPGGSAKILEKL